MTLVYSTPKKAKVSESDRRIRLVRGDETDKERWLRCVHDARLLVMKRDHAKMKICELCLEACGGEIKWGGGGHWSGFKNQMNVTKFATDIGIHPKTLLEWMAVKRYVYDNINVKYQKEFQWCVLAKVRRVLNIKRDIIPSKTKVTALYEKYLDEKNAKSINIKGYLSSLMYNLKDVGQLPEKDKKEIKEICHKILKLL